MCTLFLNCINYPRPNSTSGRDSRFPAGDTYKNNNGSKGNQGIDTLIMPRRIKDTGGDEEYQEVKIKNKSCYTNDIFEERRDDSNEALDLSVISSRLPSSGNVALEALQHTKVAVAQFAATAIANAQCFGDRTSDLSMVQTTIYNVQRQHLMQLQLIQHLQSQLKNQCFHNAEGDASEQNDDHVSDETVRTEECTNGNTEVFSKAQVLHDLYGGKENTKTDLIVIEKNLDKYQKLSDVRLALAPSILGSSENKSDVTTTTAYQPLLCDISSALASSIITNHDPLPAPNEPNCLEMLQRRTEEVLDSASQSLHASQLQEAEEKDTSGRGETFKHRCKYCGKIFGSYSALQIHLRSHTGERPFHCNVCGSKFTTKGNLKVHCQRHSQVFPPIQLPSSVSYVAAQIGSLSQDILLQSDTVSIRLPFQPQQGLTPQSSETRQRLTSLHESEQSMQNFVGRRNISEGIRQMYEAKNNHEKPEDLSKLNKLLTFEESKSSAKELNTVPLSEKLEETENTYSSKQNFGLRKRSFTATPPSEAKIFYQEDHNNGEILTKMCKRSSTSRNSITNNLDLIPSDFSRLQMERIDKSWEDLIEIDKTSETFKLQQLVDNIENKLTDPNQCIFCQKVMSCRSSLQMHIRTHTGERPFRCRICGRAFATKGNLKAHMSIHKIKPPMRSQFKCPVCHQKFSNGIVLQQHILTHTIDESGSGIGQGGENALSISEYNARLKVHMDGCSEDQNSVKSLGISENYNFSTTSDYSGQRSESSQGDIDDFMLLEAEENTSSRVSSEKMGNDELDEKSNYEDCRKSAESFEAIDLSSRVAPSDGDKMMSKKKLDSTSLPEIKPNVLLVAAASDEMTSIYGSSNYPLFPIGPLGFMGINSHGSVCKICLNIFPNPTALADHYQIQHTKDLTNSNVNNCDTAVSKKVKGNEQIIGSKNNSPPHDRSSMDALQENINKDPQSDTENTINILNDGSKTPPQCFKQQTHADAEQSLMKMQLLSSLPHETNSSHQSAEAALFPLGSKDFQQALLSIGSPSSNLDLPAYNKHFCHVCRRNFSSSSALQIHMRTHTGDKPFQCNVCQKAFTTKGNLKVHMGTHMWSNPTSRRGRRMSLELPMQRQSVLPQETEFMQRHSEVFFPYFSPFFNGFKAQPNEIGAVPFHAIQMSHHANSSKQNYTPSVLGLQSFLGRPYNFPNIQNFDQQNKTSVSPNEIKKSSDSPTPVETQENSPAKIKTEECLDGET